jgi:hypothetical protein
MPPHGGDFQKRLNGSVRQRAFVCAFAGKESWHMAVAAHQGLSCFMSVLTQYKQSLSAN